MRRAPQVALSHRASAFGESALSSPAAPGSGSHGAGRYAAATVPAHTTISGGAQNRSRPALGRTGTDAIRAVSPATVTRRAPARDQTGEQAQQERRHQLRDEHQTRPGR
jgi:hypothetical protein